MSPGCDQGERFQNFVKLRLKGFNPGSPGGAPPGGMSPRGGGHGENFDSSIQSKKGAIIKTTSTCPGSVAGGVKRNRTESVCLLSSFVDLFGHFLYFV